MAEGSVPHSLFGNNLTGICTTSQTWPNLGLGSSYLGCLPALFPRLGLLGTHMLSSIDNLISSMQSTDGLAVEQV